MDDLDHSMRIAEFDWTCFCDESEECDLLWPSLAVPDDASLSDSEDSENSSSVCSSQQGTQQSPGVNSDESSAAGCSTAEESRVELSMKLDESGAGGEQAEDDSVDSEICPDCPEGNVCTKEAHMKSAEESSDNTTNTPQTETIHVQCSGASDELKKEEGDAQTGPGESRNEPDPLFVNRTLNANEPHAADRAVAEDVDGGVASLLAAPLPRAEKERWFVTVNDSPARERVRAASVKKKRRQKKTCKNSHTLSPRQEKSAENGPKSEANTDQNESQGGKDVGGFTQSDQNFVQNSDPESVSDSSQMSCEGDSVSEKLVTFHPPKENITDPMTGRNKHEAGSSATAPDDTFAPKDPSQLESAESEGFDDGAEFLSIHSYDSESYVSAAESVEDTPHRVMEKNLQPVDFMQLQAESAQGRQSDSTLGCNVAATNCDAYEGADVEPTLTFPSAGQQTANKMPDDNSACNNNARSTTLHVLLDTPGLQRHRINLSASGGSSGDQNAPLPVPDLTATPCSVADSPERYAEATGHARPVYAISAFWDEMEKLTINDILQLRKGRIAAPGETQETATANVDESPASHGSLVDTAECNLCDGGLMDTSDTADSDYFTQPDESKPDRSSCEFSTSDFEEEYWQFLSASGDPSPDPHSKNQQRTRTSSHEEEEEEEDCTSSEGKQTPVPVEDFAGQWFEDQESHAWLRRITKSRSMHDVQALSKEDLTLPFGNNENSLFPSSCQSPEDIVVLDVSDSLGTLMPPPFLYNTDVLDERYQISFPEVFEYFFTEDTAKNDSRCVAVYDPEDVSVAPAFDYTLGTFRDETSLFSQCGKETPIPIFSCSRPVRELTFPKPDYVFLSTDYRAAEEEVDALSPIRVVSRSFIQASRCGMSAAAAGDSRSWMGLLSMRKIRFHDKGSIWCWRSGAWVFPAEAQSTENEEQTITALTEGTVSSAPARWFREVAMQQSILGTIHATRRDGIFSTLRQSDMCLVCIAFASWVLRSSDPESADAWKAALLANVSALSAIQYLRQYVKKKTSPPQDDP